MSALKKMGRFPAQCHFLHRDSSEDPSKTELTVEQITEQGDKISRKTSPELNGIHRI